MVRLQDLAIPEPGGGYSIAVPALAGCYSAAETVEELPDHVIEAAEGWLAAQHDRAKDETVRIMTT
jgi:predicted RNase H-like HicB family nuclease